MGINPAHSKDRFNEAHDLIIRAWTEPGPFEFVGKHYHFKYVNPWPLPYQKPHPPIWVPSQGSKDTIEWAARMKYTYCQTLSPIKSVAKVFDGFRAAAEKSGYTASPDQLAWSMSMFIAETDKKAREMAKPHIEALVNQLLSIPLQMLLPPGYTSPESLKKIADSRIVGHHKTIDNLVEEGVVIIGSPETAREKLEEFSELAGFGSILVKTQFGTMPTQMARENIEAIAREILPKFQD
jgi:alkanesulfonate monooxygenase SsuD/methylene tetrahydromethanopterin reductase-like flavin-dependent oxidoreductase (luciferase family)